MSSYITHPHLVYQVFSASFLMYFFPIPQLNDRPPFKQFLNSQQTTKVDNCRHYSRTCNKVKNVLPFILIETFLTSSSFCLYFSGTQTMDLTVKEGGPLPFAYHILTTVFNYGNRAFVKYPTDIVDCFKQTFPEGFSWERVMTYEDGGTCIATNDIT